MSREGIRPWLLKGSSQRIAGQLLASWRHQEQTTRSKIRVARERYRISEGWKAGDKGGCLEVCKFCKRENQKRDTIDLGEKERKHGSQRGVFESLSNLLESVILSARVYSRPTVWSYVSSVVRSLLIALRSLTSFPFRKVTRTSIRSSYREILLGQDEKKWQDRDERPAVPGRLIVKDKSRKGKGRLFAPRGLKNDVREGQVRIPFCVFPPFFSVISIREDVPATLAALPAGCHRYRQRWVFHLSFRSSSFRVLLEFE